MMGLIPFGGLSITGGTQTQALTTTPGQVVAWSAAGGANSDQDTYNGAGDPSVRPDYANNRILVNSQGGAAYQTAQGGSIAYCAYLVTLTLEGTLATGTALLIAQIYKNGVAVAKLKQKAYGSGGTTGCQVVLQGILQVSRADAPLNIATFADPPSTELIGPGKAPQTMVPITVYLSVSASTDTLTIAEAQLTVVRLG